MVKRGVVMPGLLAPGGIARVNQFGSVFVIGIGLLMMIDMPSQQGLCGEPAVTAAPGSPCSPAFPYMMIDSPGPARSFHSRFTDGIR
ncbi:hypothetical protein Misp01_54230 [Microtetraspora sp. NBRC 13810]|nr:hypothetical protein Misp01_54230 [Microtetraspora sp. NBRC 13810]